MPTARNGETEIEYDSFGDPADPTALLIRGLTSQMIAWQEDFCWALVDRGFHAVRMDNRDVGLSSRTPGPPPDLVELLARAEAGADLGEVPYTLSDMAADGVAVLDAVGAEQGHVVGVSLGGMIAQMMAIEHPDRVATLTST